jgi:hypothetical protein
MQMAHRAGFKYWKTDNSYNMWKTLKFSGDMQTIFRYSPTHPPYTEADSYNHHTHTVYLSSVYGQPTEYKEACEFLTVVIVEAKLLIFYAETYPS